MTSGYSVPWARNFTLPIFFACALKTSMNSLPMIFRFFSGSVTPLSAFSKRFEASTQTRGRPSFDSKRSFTCAASSLRSRPLSTKTQVSCDFTA